MVKSESFTSIALHCLCIFWCHEFSDRLRIGPIYYYRRLLLISRCCPCPVICECPIDSPAYFLVSLRIDFSLLSAFLILHSLFSLIHYNHCYYYYEKLQVFLLSPFYGYVWIFSIIFILLSRSLKKICICYWHPRAIDQRG